MNELLMRLMRLLARRELMMMMNELLHTWFIMAENWFNNLSHRPRKSTFLGLLYRRNRRRKKPPCLLTVTSIFIYFNCFLEPLKRAATNMNQVIGCTARVYRLTFFISAASPFEMIDCFMDLSCVVLSNCLLGLKVFFNCS